MLVGVLKLDLFDALKVPNSNNELNRLEMDRGFVDGIMPVLLTSPTVSDKAADKLNDFYEMTTLKESPEKIKE
jgi:hypothetical protein